MRLRHVTRFICCSEQCRHKWQKRKGDHCAVCGTKIPAGASCVQETDTPYGKSTLYDCYRPPRPRNMSPVAYRRKYGCVDHNFTNVTNGRYYCNPAHCSMSWKNKTKRDEHLKRAYGALM